MRFVDFAFRAAIIVIALFCLFTVTGLPSLVSKTLVSLIAVGVLFDVLRTSIKEK